jgi:uncharacterized protein involved in exopolysaccharide biosynthesis
MFGVQAVLPAEEPATPAPATPPPPEASASVKPTSKLPLILGGIIVLLLAAIAVLLITMRK